MEKPPVVSAGEWQRARDELLVAEKEATRALDAIAARRRRLPMVKFCDDYVFDTPDGKKTLADLFGDQIQLAVYQFMDRGPDAYLPGVHMVHQQRRSDRRSWCDEAHQCCAGTGRPDAGPAV